MKRTIAAMLVVLMLISCLTACGNPDAEEIDWENIFLSKVLPEPQSNKMDINSNSDEELSVFIYAMSENDYFEYMRLCKEDWGFNIDTESFLSLFYAYNQDGYYLKLSYTDSKKMMHIDLEAPIALSEFEWPAIAVAGGLPKPESEMGRFSGNYDDTFYLYVGNTTIEAYKAYVEVCVTAGYTFDSSKGESSYSAANAAGYRVSCSYKGGDTMYISFEAPDEDPDSSASEATTILLPLPVSDDDYLWTNYQDIVDDFTEAGFVNVTAVPLKDITENDWLVSEGEYDQITVDGSASFREGDIHPADVEIIITYHSYAENETANDRESSEAPVISVTMDEEEFLGMNYAEAEALLREMGFAVFEYQVLETDDQSKVNDTVGAVEIKSWAFGNGDFSKGDTYGSDAIVVLWYYEREEIVSSNLTVENNADLATLLALSNPEDPFVSTFARQYSGRIIEFDACVHAIQNHGDYDTRYDILIGAGDFDENSMRGPNFRLTDVNAFDMDLDTLWLEDELWVGRNIYIIAIVGEYDAGTSIFELDVIKVEIRN